MVKKVLANSQVVHVFAQQAQEDGRSHNGNLWFHGDTLYSYRTPICRIVEGINGGKVALITTARYSVSTSQHMPSKGHFAFPAFHVPSIGATGGMHQEPGDSYRAGKCEPNHNANLAMFNTAYCLR